MMMKHIVHRTRNTNTSLSWCKIFCFELT